MNHNRNRSRSTTPKSRKRKKFRTTKRKKISSEKKIDNKVLTILGSLFGGIVLTTGAIISMGLIK
jgi:hypothetical protein